MASHKKEKRIVMQGVRTWVLYTLLVNIIAPTMPMMPSVSAATAPAGNVVEAAAFVNEAPLEAETASLMSATAPLAPVAPADPQLTQQTFHSIYLPSVEHNYYPKQAKTRLENYVTPMLALPDEIVTYTLAVHSIGDLPLSTGDLSNTVPLSLTVLADTLSEGVYDAQTRTIRWTSPQLNPGEALTVTFQAQIDAPAMTVLQNQAGFAATSVGHPINLAVSAASTATLLVGEALTATLTEAGGVLNSPDGRVQLVAPAGAVTQSVPVRVSDFPLPPLEAGGLHYIAIFDVQALGQAGAPLRNDRGHTTFLQPLSVTLSLADNVAWQHAYLLHFEDSAGRVQVPVTSTFDVQTGVLSAERQTFSGHAAAAQNPFPTDGSYFRFHNWPSADLYSGGVSYQMPLETPSGNGGIGPGLSLNYSSRSIDGMLGLVQSADVGLGWTLGSAAKIVRSVTTHKEAGVPHSEIAWEYKDEFTLHINGSAYRLVWREGVEPDATPGCAYYTEEWSAIRILRYNALCGYESSERPANDAGEYWVVTTPDGTVYRMGTTADSEQMVTMRLYNPSACSLHGCPYDYWHRFGGYAGDQPGLIASTWSVNSVQDTHGNVMHYQYFETGAYAGDGQYYDKESHLSAITYGGNVVAGAPSHYRVQVDFEERRSTAGAWHDNGPPPYLTHNYSLYDTYRVQAIKVCVDTCTGDNILREYVLNYQFPTLPWPGYEWVHHDYPPEYTLLASLATYGRGGAAGGAVLPLTTFEYIPLDQMDDGDHNPADGSWYADPFGGWFGEKLRYFRLKTVNNGYGATASFDYEVLQSNYIRSYRVTQNTQQDGLGNVMTSTYQYGAPCFVEGATCRRSQPESHVLSGHDWTTVETNDYDNALLSRVQHYFDQDPNGALGREFKMEIYDPTGALTQSTVMTWATQTDYNGLTGQYHSELRSTATCLNNSACTLTEYTYDEYGNVSREDSHGDIDVSGDELSIHRTFVPNEDKWIVNKPATEDVRENVGASANPILKSTRYFYDGAPTFTTPPVYGDLTQSQVGLSGWGWVTATSEFNAYGNPTHITDTLGYASTIAYDSAFRQFPVDTCNALNQCTRAEYYGVNAAPEDETGAYFGAVYRTWGPNGEETAIYSRYDAFGREIAVVQPGDNWKFPSVTFEYHDGAHPGLWAVARQREQHNQTGTLDYYVYHDGLGRMLQTWTETEGGFAISGQAHNALGAVVKSYMPITGTTAPAYTPLSGDHITTTYDVLGRVTQVQNPDGTAVNTQYAGWETRVIDAESHVHRVTNDAYGRTTQVEEFLGDYPNHTFYAATQYEYDLLGNLVQVEDAQNKTTTMSYDPLGRKTTMHDPDMGNWFYGYDAAGNLIHQIDAKEQATHFYYDPLSRLKGKTYGVGVSNPADYTRPADLGTYAITYTYDAGQYGIGQRTGMAYPGGAVTYRYDERGRLTAETQAIDTLDTYTTTYKYDALNRLIMTGYPDGEGVFQSYNNGGQPYAVTSSWGDSFVNATTYDVQGQMKGLSLGNNLNVDYTYYPADEHSYLLRSIQIPELMNLSYNYDDAGNVASIADGVLSQEQQFTYDELDRLTNARTAGASSGSYNESYRYDATGNLMTLGDREYTYGDANHIHAVTQVSHSMGINQYTYDANGNMNRRVEIDAEGETNTYTQTFDLENRLAVVTMTNSVSQTVTRFIYDGDGRRLAQVTDEGTTLYIGEHFEEFWQGIFLDAPDLLTAAQNLRATSPSAPATTSGESLSHEIAPTSNTAPAQEAFAAPAHAVAPQAPTAPTQPHGGADMMVSVGGDYEFKITGRSESSICQWDRVHLVSPTSEVLFDNAWNQVNETRRRYITTGNSIQLTFYHYESNWSDTCGLAEQPVESWNQTTDKVNIIVLGANHWRVEFEDHDSTGGERDVILEIYPVAQVTPPTWVDAGAACVADSNRTVTWNTYADWWYRVQRADDAAFTQGLVSVDMQASGATAAHTFTDHGTQTYYYRVQTLGRTGADPSGWSETLTRGHDRTAPASVASLNGLKNGEWYVTSVLVTLDATDTGCAGLGQIRYRRNSDAWETYQASFSVTEVGTHTIEYYAVDLTGNTETTKSITFKLDPTQRVAKVTKYYYHGGQRVAMRSPDNVVTYLHSDHLGSTSLSTDANGAVVSKQRYYPFGAVRDAEGESPTDFGFTGQRLDDSTGLMYYKARYYAAGLGRFVSADTVVASPGNPQAWNRYSYVSNNPFRYTDPTGYLTDDQIMEYTDYDTDEELTTLKDQNGALYQLLLITHLFDMLHGINKAEEIFGGTVSLNERGRLRIGDLSLEQFVAKSPTGGATLRFFGDYNIYQMGQFGDGNEIYGGWFADNQYPPILGFEYTEVTTAESAFWWALSDNSVGLIVGEGTEAGLGAAADAGISSAAGPYYYIAASYVVGTAEQACQGPPAGHAKGDVVMRAYYSVDQDPETGQKLEFTTVWVETTVVRGNTIIKRDWESVNYRR